MQRRNMRHTRPQSPDALPPARYGELRTVTVKQTTACFKCNAVLPEGAQALFRMFGVKYACVGCGYEKSEGSYQ